MKNRKDSVIVAVAKFDGEGSTNWAVAAL